VFGALDGLSGASRKTRVTGLAGSRAWNGVAGPGVAAGDRLRLMGGLPGCWGKSGGLGCQAAGS